MPKNYSSHEIRHRLEKINKKFSNLIKKNTEVSENYKAILESYQHLITLIEQIKSSSTIILYKLEAQLGIIQCKLNSISLSSSYEAEICTNDTQLETLETELNLLFNTTIRFEEKLPKNKPSLRQDYDIFFTQLNDYKMAWPTYCYDIQAAYYYNYADTLVENTTKTNVDMSTQLENLEKIIALFETAAYFYEKNGRIKEKNETQLEIDKIKAISTGLKKKTFTTSNIKDHYPDTEKNFANKVSSSPLHTESTSANTTTEDMNEQKVTLPLKKRKYIEPTTLFSKEFHHAETTKNKSNKIDNLTIPSPIKIVAYGSIRSNVKNLKF